MATIKDVARQAGVSVATVSRVYNASDTVAPPTRERVLRVATALGYAPHGAARSLITSKTNTLGVLLPDLYGEFFSEVIRGIDLAARRAGYHLLVSGSHDAERDMDAALRSMRGRVDGLIVMAPEMETATAVRSLPEKFPVVLLNPGDDGRPFDAITIANHEGASAMVRHLIGAGHRRVAILKGAARNHDAAERLRGWRDALALAGLAHGPELELEGDFSEESGVAAVARLLALAPRPTAHFASNDAMARGAMSALREAGLRVPEDVAVAGFDDIPMARYVEPPLSSVHVDIASLGERSARRLLERIEGGATLRPAHEVLPATLVVRRSCGGAAHGERSPPRTTRARATAARRR
jgi:LacI family transcriptional regulator